MLASGALIDIGDHTVEVLADPSETGDRYRLRIEADPGGPGIRGDFPHVHPSLVETFTCVSGDMVVRVGRHTSSLPEGATAEVAPGSVHGFLNTGSATLVVDSEVVFPNGYSAAEDLLDFAAAYDRLRTRGPVSRRTGQPPLLDMAVLAHAHRRAMVQPGIAGALMGPLALLGRRLGHRPDTDPDA
jgi:quercetin dioxygenase-like cupin family protein